MSRPDYFDNPDGAQFKTDVYCRKVLPSQACITPVMLNGIIPASQVYQQYVMSYAQDDGSDITAVTFLPLFTARGVEELLGVEVVCIDAPEGGDKKFTVDLKKCSEASPTPASVLYEPVDYDNAKSDCEVAAGVITSETLADGDTIGLSVAISGSTGNQGQGLLITVTWKQTA